MGEVKELKQELIDKLIELLEHEYKVYENIFRLSKDKTNIIVEGRVSELENVVKLEQALVMQISRIDKQREELLEEIAKEVQLGEGGLNVSELKKHSNESQCAKLEDYQQRMIDLVEQLNHANQLNSKLIRNSLEFIEFSLNIISEADLTSNNYGNKGDSSKTAKKNLFDVKL